MTTAIDSYSYISLSLYIYIYIYIYIFAGSRAPEQEHEVQGVLRISRLIQLRPISLSAEGRLYMWVHNIYIYISLSLYIYIYTHVCIYIYIYTYHIYIYIYIDIYIYIYIYIILSLLRFVDSNLLADPMDMRIPPLEIKILLESNPLKSRSLVRRLAVSEIFRYLFH